MKELPLIMAKFIFWIVVSLFPPDITQQLKPEVPYVQKNICPFECCQYGKWTAKCILTAYKYEGDIQKVAYTLKPGEEFMALTGNVHIKELGIAMVTESFDSFKENDVVFVLSYKGQGRYDIWSKGEVKHDIVLFWSDKNLFPPGPVVMKQPPKMFWWVLIQNRRGEEAWLMLGERG